MKITINRKKIEELLRTAFRMGKNDVPDKELDKWIWNKLK